MPIIATPTPRRSHKHWSDFLDEEILLQPRTEECFTKIVNDPHLQFSLPPRRSLAGAVLKHVYKFVDDLVIREKPLVFKLGYTHDAQWRFRNEKYGYCKDTFHKWSNMCVLYVGAESTSAAFVEAAAIQRFKGYLAQH